MWPLFITSVISVAVILERVFFIIVTQSKRDPKLVEAILSAAEQGDPREVVALATVLVNHFPLRYDLARLPAIPRFTLWCGTRRTEDWHTRFRAIAVISGHLHIPSTRHRDGVRFEEVSVGYPRQWASELGLESKLREILPGPPRRV